MFNDDIAKRLENVQIENVDACKIIESRDAENSFHYADPPYIDSNQAHYGGYNEIDYKRLLDTLSNVKGKFLLSSYPSAILDEYIKRFGWYTKTFTKTLSASKGVAGQKRKTKVEVLTANYPI